MSEESRKEFERDAEPYGFDLTRVTNLTGEPWSDYLDRDTGQRWAGWLAARSTPMAGAEPPKQGAALPSVDELAQQIRWLNGNGKTGAAALAEKLLDWLQSRAPAAAAEDADEIVEMVGDLVGIGHGAWDMVSAKELVTAFKKVLGSPSPLVEPAPTKCAKGGPICDGCSGLGYCLADAPEPHQEPGWVRVPVGEIVAWCELDGDEWVCYSPETDAGVFEHITNYQQVRHGVDIFPLLAAPKEPKP